MRILFAPHGTRGDVDPLIALALAARARGHAVRFVAPANAVDSIRVRGIACESNGIDVEAMLRDEQADLESLRWQMSHLSRVLIPRLFESIVRAADGIDLIVGSGVQLAAPSIAEWCRARYVTAVFCPCAVPSRDTPPPVVHAQRLPRWVNLLLWRVGLPATDAFLRGPLNAARARLGLAPLGKPMRTMLGAGVLVAADRELAPLAEGGPLIAQTDAWLLEDDTPLDPRIDQFLRAGAPPIYIGFGSMVTRKSPELGAQVARAVRSIGCRVVLAGGWASLDRAVHDSDAVLTIRHAPHAKLLPRVTAAVHHGGAGTTTAAAKAGIPQVVVPHILDQYYWGHRVETLALGPRPLPIGRVTANALTARISAALDDSRHRDAAHRLGRQLAGRSGVSAGVDFLERAGAATAGA